MGLLLYLSLTNSNWTFPETDFVGFKNYIDLLQDSDFRQSLFTTLKFTFLIVIFPNIVGLFVALLLDKKGKLYNAVRVLIFTPMTLSAVVVSVIWGSILTDNGFLNAVLEKAHLGALTKSWIGSQTWALPSIAFVVSWQMVGFCMVIYLADLQSIPRELIEAAKIDGCNERQLFRRISWPLLAGSLTINTTVLSLVGLRLYDQVVVMTAGGPSGSTETIATTMIRTAFQTARVAYASAMAVVLTLVVAVVTSLFIYFLTKREVQR